MCLSLLNIALFDLSEVLSLDVQSWFFSDDNNILDSCEKKAIEYVQLVLDVVSKVVPQNK